MERGICAVNGMPNWVWVIDKMIVLNDKTTDDSGVALEFEKAIVAR
jgi:hypothetical protein